MLKIITLLLVVVMSACATTQSPSNFERCVKVVAGDSVMETGRMHAADWCAAKVGI